MKNRLLFSIFLMCVLSCVYLETAAQTCPTSLSAPSVNNATHCNGTATLSIANVQTGNYEWSWSGNEADIFVDHLSEYLIPNTSVSVDLDFSPNGTRTSVEITNLQTQSLTLFVRRKNGSSCSPFVEVVAQYIPLNVSAGSTQTACVTGSAFALTGGSPSGGSWSSSTSGAVSSGSFNPSVAGPGNHTVYYYYADIGTGCEATASKTVTVYGITSISTQNVCESIRAYVLDHGLSGVTGTWSGTHVSNGIFRPFEAQQGNHTVSYNYTTSQGCTGTANGTVSVYDDTPGSAPTITTPNVTVCGSGTASFTVPNPGNQYDYFLWFDENGLILNGSGQPHTSGSYTTPSLSATKTYDVQGIDNEGCATALATATATYIVKPSVPSVNDATNCEAGETLGTASVSIISPGSFTYAWTNNVGTPLQNDPGGIDYTVQSNGTVVNIAEIPDNQNLGLFVRAKSTVDPTCQSNEKEVNVIYRTLPVVSIGTSVPAVVCTSTPQFTLTGSSPANGVWKIDNNTVTSFNAATYGAGTKTVWYTKTDEYGCVGADDQDVVIQALITPSALTVRTVIGTPAEINPPNPGANKTYNWYTASTGGTAFTTADTYTTGNVSTNLTYFISLKDETLSACESVSRGTVSVFPNYLPTVSAGADQQLVVPQRSVTLVPSYYDYDGSVISVLWTKMAGPTISFDPIESNLVLTNLPNGTYVFRITVTDNHLFWTTDDVQVTVVYPPNNYNSVTTESILKSGVTGSSAVEALPVSEKTKSIQYIDGLGRPFQQVQWKNSPAEKDMIQPIEYDQFGREPIKYLPYTSTGNNGYFKADALDPNDYQNGKQAQFYNGSTQFVPSDSKPYAKTVFEASPLNRVLKQGAAGVEWQPENNHVIQKEYLSNGSSDVYRFVYKKTGALARNPATDYYVANSLLCNKTIDEHGNDVLEYVDKQGRVVCKKVKAWGSVYAATHYIYDSLSNLVVVIPPEGLKAIQAKIQASQSINTPAETWGFHYKYDSRKRMVSKKVPGADWVYMVYDDRDRLVLTQDGAMRSGKLWHFTKYDELNRPVLTGILTTSEVRSLSYMQHEVDTFYRSNPALGKFYESRGTTVHGYTNQSYPLLSDQFQYWTATYYDDYNWITGLYSSNRLLFSSDEFPNFSEASKSVLTTGLATGTKIKVLDGGPMYLWSATYYDDRGRVIQTVSDNYKLGTDRITNILDFSGKVLRSKTLHQTNDVKWKDKMITFIEGGRIIVNNSPTPGHANCGAVSSQLLPASTDGWVEAMVDDPNTNWMVGLTATNQVNIDYAVNASSSGSLSTWRGASWSGMLHGSNPLKKGEILRLHRVGSTITFYRNGTQFGTAMTNVSTGPLMIDASLYANNMTIGYVKSSFTVTSDTVWRRYKYDHAGRVKQVWHRLNAGDSVLLIENEYNELGQLIDKNLHSVNNGTTSKQSSDYRYNIRGWLTSINGSELAQDSRNTDATDDGKDLFGMDLLYNEVITDVNTGGALYNGNISAMKWSVNRGLSTLAQHAYQYTYDTLNRIKSAAFRNKASSQASWSATNMYSESGYKYDLNGNLKALIRNGQAGTSIDNIAYDYGTGDTRSNKLLKVADSGNKKEGFLDGVNTDNDYTYDANGNMIGDKNKNLTANYLGYLNLLSSYARNSTGWVVYCYDATGRKLLQRAAYTQSHRLTDYAGEFQYEDDVLQFVQHEEGRIMMAGREDIYYHDGSGVFGVTPEGSGTDIDVETPSSYSGQTLLGVYTTAGAVNPGIVMKTGIPVVAGERFLVRAKGYGSPAPPHIRVRVVSTSGTVDLQWPSSKFPSTADAQSWVEQAVEIPAGTVSGATMTVGASYSGTMPSVAAFYINEFEVVKLTTAAPEYQYHLKDHLGNVRVTFTSRDKEEAKATLENNNATAETAAFQNREYARRVYSQIFDRTNGSSPGYAQRLSGSANEKVGLAKSFSVDKGDVIKAKVWAKYFEAQDTTVALQALFAYFANPAGSGGVVVDGSGYSTAGTGAILPWMGEDPDPDQDVPKAYLNYIWINKNYDINSVQFVAKQISEAALENGSDGSHEEIALNETIAEAGYVYVYLSNDDEEEREVYFDDFEVEHKKWAIVESQDYYPFGLTFNSNQRENALSQEYKYNSKEEQTELGLGWLDYGARMYQPELGKFFTQDRFASKYFDTSPYSYGANNPILYVDINGDSVWTTTQRSTDKNGNITVTNTINITGKVLKQSSGKSTAQGVAAGLNSRLNAQSTTSKPVKNADGSTTTTITKMNAQYSAAGSMNDVSSSDHLVVLVDDVTGQADPKLGGGPAGGQAVLGGQISYVEDAGAVETAFHEVGHNLGMIHPGSNNGNPMSYNGQGNNFDALQLMQAFNRARNGALNQGGNSAIMGTAFPKVQHGQFFSPTTTQSRPFMVAPDKRARIPLPLMNN